jgi:competence protein ComEC
MQYIKWQSMAMVRFAIALCTGICAAHYCDRYSLFLLVLLVLQVLTFFIFYLFLGKKRYQYPVVNGLITLSAVVSFGYLLYVNNQEVRNKYHYKHYQKDAVAFQVVIGADWQQKGKNAKTEAIVTYLKTTNGNWQTAKGKVLLHLDSLTFAQNNLQYGDVLLVNKKLYPLNEMSNPSGFNYAQFLHSRQIFAQFYLKGQDFLKIKNDPPNWVKSFAFKCRNQLSNILKTHVKEQREQALVLALLLGIKDGLDNDLKKAYSASGAMHILAVSGLHVGVLLIIMQFLLKNILRLHTIPKYGSWIIAFFCIFSLWLYAFMTGLSASVLRAATMFSFVAVAQATQRRTNIYNTLAVSVICLLCYNPRFLFEIGFQLSYLAVLGIVYLYPKIQLWYVPHNHITKYVWDIIAVSIAAQVATTPISLYYFHQFPNYFLLTNVFAIPLSFVLMCGIIVFLLVSFVPFLNLLVAHFVYYVAFFLNSAVLFIEQLPYASSVGWSMQLEQLILLYLLILLVLSWLYWKKMSYLYAIFAVILLISGIQIERIAQQKQQFQFIAYYVRNGSALAIQQGNQAALWYNIKTENLPYLKENWQQYAYSAGIKSVNWLNDAPQNLVFKEHKGWFWTIQNGKIITVATTATIPALPATKIDYLIVSGSNIFKNIENLASSVVIQQLIIDNTVPFYAANLLEKQAKKLNIPCHNMQEKGAFMVRLDEAYTPKGNLFSSLKRLSVQYFARPKIFW